MAAPVRLIVNPSAGGGRSAKLVAPVEAALRGHGLTVRTERTRSLDHARELALAAHAARELPVTLSGDGLAGAVAGALATAGAAASGAAAGAPASAAPEAPLMGVLPGGRGNDFVRAAGIPRDAVAACAVIATGTARALDLGDVDGRPFIGIASLGFDSEANRIANAAPSLLGPLVYAYGALRALVAWRPATFTLDLDGATRTVTGWSIAAANGPAYGGGMLLAPDASFQDGALDVVLSLGCSKPRFLGTLPKVFKGTHVDTPHVEVLRGRTLVVDADRPFAVYADGDPIGTLPATITVRPGAIRVLLP